MKRVTVEKKCRRWKFPLPEAADQLMGMMKGVPDSEIRKPGAAKELWESTVETLRERYNGKTTTSTAYRGDQYVLGDYVENGRVVGKYPAPNGRPTVFLLVRNNGPLEFHDSYTIYLLPSDAVCDPTVARLIPHSVLKSITAYIQAN